MQINENEFFREVAMRVCSSLRLGKALHGTLLYLKTIMPADAIFLSIYDPELHLLRGIAMASVDEIRDGESEPPIPLSKRDIERLEKSERILADPEIAIYQHLDLSGLANRRGLGDGRDYSNISSMRLLLSIENEQLADLSVMAFGGDRYHEQHTHLLKLVRDPFAIAVASALEHQKVLRLKDMLADDKRFLQEELIRKTGHAIIGKEGGLRETMDLVAQVAPMESPVLVLGETGSGKEVVADAIHEMSGRKDGPLIKVNCGGIPENLIDSELFGHEKGAFTGAISQKRGRFERAVGGTIFLDEIGELPPQAQVRLLRVLQNREIERVGGTRSIPVDIRVLAATNRDLEAMVRAGEFREDLFFRLNVFPIVVPPLRDRKEDISPLVHYFIEKKSKDMRLPETPKPAPGAVFFLESYDWPGNVREVENLIERALIRRRGSKDDAPLRFDNIFVSLRDDPSQEPGGGDDVLWTLDELNARHIRKVLKTTRGKISGNGGGAHILGVNASTLRSKMKKLGIPFGRERLLG